MSELGGSEIPKTETPELEEGETSSPVTDDKSDGEISEGELSDEGEISDDGELPESEPEPEKEVKPPTASPNEKSPDRFDRFEVWKDAMVTNMKSAFNKAGCPEAMISSSGSSESESDGNSAMYMNDSEIPPNLQSFDGAGNQNLLGALGVTEEPGAEGENGVKRKKKKKKKGAPSEWWERHKEIYEKMKERRLEMDAQRAQTHCKFFQKGFCKEGDTCPFLHEVLKKLDVCKYFIKNLDCHKGENCPYMHSDYPCKYFHLRGFCYNDKDCRFSHAELTDDTRQVIEGLKNSHERFKRGRHHSSDGPGYDRDYEKPLFSDPDANHPNKKVLLPTPSRDHDRPRHHERERRDDRRGRPYNSRGSPRGGFRGRGRGFYNNRGFDNHHHRGGFDNHRGGRGFNNNFNNFNNHNNFNPDFNNNNAPPPAFNNSPPNNFPNPLPVDTLLPPPSAAAAVNFTPDNRPPPPPPPSNPASAVPDFKSITAEPIGLLVPEAKAVVCASRDPRLKTAAEKDRMYPSLADMFKSLDPTASPFG